MIYALIWLAIGLFFFVRDELTFNYFIHRAFRDNNPIVKGVNWKKGAWPVIFAVFGPLSFFFYLTSYSWFKDRIGETGGMFKSLFVIKSGVAYDD